MSTRPTVATLEAMATTSTNPGILRRHVPAFCAGLWCCAVSVALLATLSSLDDDSFDGLNNLFQVPFALPWFLLPLPAWFDWSSAADAWAVAAMGWLNGLLLYTLLRRLFPPRQGAVIRDSAGYP